MGDTVLRRFGQHSILTLLAAGGALLAGGTIWAIVTSHGEVDLVYDRVAVHADQGEYRDLIAFDKPLTAWASVQAGHNRSRACRYS